MKRDLIVDIKPFYDDGAVLRYDLYVLYVLRVDLSNGFTEDKGGVILSGPEYVESERDAVLSILHDLARADRVWGTNAYCAVFLFDLYNNYLDLYSLPNGKNILDSSTIEQLAGLDARCLSGAEGAKGRAMIHAKRLAEAFKILNYDVT